MAVSLRPEHLKRYKDVARLLVKHGRTSWSVVTRDDLTSADGDTDAIAADAGALARDLESMGPTFVKLGQLLSTRADFFPPEYLTALSRLQDACEPVPGDEVAAIVEAELGVRLSKAFAEFDPVPLASASLGQVHRARMRDGRPVAVKVQRPDIQLRIEQDLEAITEIAGFADRHVEAARRLGLQSMVEEFRHAMLAELDYTAEAANLEVLAANLADFDRIVVPCPVPDFTTRRVLTMDFVGGKKITALGPLARLELDGAVLAEQLFRAYLQQVLVDGFFHADPHPGNVFLTDDGRLALLDLGMVARISPAMQDQLIKLLLAISEGDGTEVADVAAELGRRCDDITFDEETFRRRVTALVTEQQGAAVDDLAAGRVVAELSRISGDCGLQPAPELTMLGKALLNLDEVARVLDPTFEPEQAIREHASALLRRRMLRSASPGNVFAAAMDVKEFAEKLPGRVNRVMDALAQGQLTLNVKGIDEAELMRGIQKLANRVTMGLVLAALIIGAAMLVRVQTSSTLFGYPALAIICFLLAAGGGFALLISILLGDRRRR